jgi:hypothetical protein
MMRMGDAPVGGGGVPGGRQVPAGDPGERRWPWESALVRVGAGFFFAVLAPVLSAAAGAPGALSGGLAVGAGVASVGLGCLFAGRRLARYLRVPRLAEFDGVVTGQWHRERNEVTSYCVAVDDGQRPTAWAFLVSRELYLALRPGMRVHVQINERRNRAIRVEAAEPPDAAG